MRNSQIFQTYALLMIFLTFAMPFITTAEQHTIENPIADAKRDINKKRWFIAGMFPICLVSVVVLASTSQSTSSDYDEVSRLYSVPVYSALIGLITGAVFPVSPPAERLIGKSAEYVSGYTKTYQLKTQWDRE